MNRYHLYLALSDFQQQTASPAPSRRPAGALSRRSAVKLLAGAAVGALGWRLAAAEAGTAGTKAGATRDKQR